MADLGAGIEDHPLFVIENSQIDSRSMKDRSKKVSDYATFYQVDRITIHAILNYEQRS